MGNASSQPSADFDYSSNPSEQNDFCVHRHASDTNLKTRSVNSDISSTKVHPLLNPQNLRSQTSTPTTAMTAQENDIPHSQGDSLTNATNTASAASAADVTMSGIGQSTANLTSQPSVMNIDSEQPADLDRPAPPRRRSTLILTDDQDFEKLKLSKTAQNSTAGVNESTPNSGSTPENAQKATVPVEIQWFQGGESVFITGSFTGWRKMIKLVKESDEKFSIKLRLPYGTHRFRFIVDNELRFSDYLPTATDQMGNFVNYIEIQTPEVSQVNLERSGEKKESEADAKAKFKQAAAAKDSKLGLTNDDDDMGNGYSRFHQETPQSSKLDYVRDIPAIFTDPSVMEQYYMTLDNNQNNNQNQSWLTPPQLPPHLESVILNNYCNTDKSNSSGALPIPNHVVLNHLATTSIKHNTLAVASVVRYKRKYATQVLYAPLQ